MSVSQWASGLSRPARIGLVVSIVWALVVIIVAFQSSFLDGYGLYDVDKFGLADFFLDLLIYAVVPLALCWGIRWIRRAH